MVEPITAVLSGIALVKSATSFIKDNISTCQDIGGIAKQIDDLFTGQQEIEKQRIKDQSNIKDQLGISTVAQSVIDAKLAREEMNEIRNLVNLRFGPNTWQEILTERKRRIDAVKENKKKLMQAKLKRQREAMLVAKQASIGISIVFFILAFFVIVWVAFAFAEETTAECMVFKPKYYMICMNEGHEYALIEQQLDILEYKKTHIIIKENPNGIDSTNRTCD